MEKKKIMSKSLTLLVTVTSLSVVLLVGINIFATASMSSANNYNSISSYKKCHVWTKSLNLATKE
jgi:hypothetical protein